MSEKKHEKRRVHVCDLQEAFQKGEDARRFGVDFHCLEEQVEEHRML